MARRHMRNLVRDDACQFGFTLRVLNQAGGNEEMPARQSNGIDLVRYDHAHSQRHAQVRMPHHALGHLVNVIGYQGVFQPLCRELEVPGKPVPQSNLALRRIQVPGTLIGVAFSDIFYVPVLFLLCGCGDSRKTAQKQESQNRGDSWTRSEEHTSELQSPCNLVCRLLLEKKKINKQKDKN